MASILRFLFVLPLLINQAFAMNPTGRAEMTLGGEKPRSYLPFQYIPNHRPVYLPTSSQSTECQALQAKNQALDRELKERSKSREQSYKTFAKTQMEITDGCIRELNQRVQQELREMREKKERKERVFQECHADKYQDLEQQLFDYEFRSPHGVPLVPGYYSEEGFREELEQTYHELSSVSPRTERNLISKIIGMLSIQEADIHFRDDRIVEADYFKVVGKEFLDIILGNDPVTGWARGIYETITGLNLVTGEKLDVYQREFAFLSIATPGVAHFFDRGLASISKRASKLLSLKEIEIIRYERASQEIRTRFERNEPLKKIINEFYSEFKPTAQSSLTENFRPTILSIEQSASSRYPRVDHSSQENSFIIRYRQNHPTVWAQALKEGERPGAWVAHPSFFEGKTMDQITQELKLKEPPDLIRHYKLPKGTELSGAVTLKTTSGSSIQATKDSQHYINTLDHRDLEKMIVEVKEMNPQLPEEIIHDLPLSIEAPKLAKEWRNTPGTAYSVKELKDSETLLHGSAGNAGFIPKEIGDKLNGKYFKSFDEFRGEFWRTVADTPRYSQEFNHDPVNLGRMNAGNSPLTVREQRFYERKYYELHHMLPIKDGGAVYNLDNLVVVTPKYHMEILHNVNVKR
jgi:hypothetical protein